jgi:Ca-activated chloride channel homolog
MFRFAQPWFLVLALLGPAMIFLYYRFRPGRAMLKFSDLSPLKSLPATTRSRFAQLPLFLFAAGISFLALGLARPQHGEKMDEISGEGVDIMVALDTSWSMKSRDFEPKNRLEVAKQVVKDFVSKRPYDRIGLVVFSAIAFTHCPLTTDHQILLNFVDRVSFCRQEHDGTAIGNAIAVAVERLKDSKVKSKIIILVTDGENNRGIDPLQGAEIAKAFKIRVYPIGIYNPSGFMQPVDDPIFGTRFVISRPQMDEGLMSRVAETTGGKYFRAVDPKALENVFAEINKLEKSKVEVKRYYRYSERFYSWVIIGLCLIVLGLALSDTYFRRLP